MRKIRGRSAHMGAIAGVAVTGLLLVLPACSSSSSGGSSGSPSGGSSAAVPPAASSAAPSGDATAGTDDGTKLTLWTRAPLEKQAKLLVAAYNASHKNQVALTVVPNDDYVAKVGAAAGAERAARPVRRRHRLRPQLGQAGPVPGPRRPRSTALPYKDSINQGHLTAGTYQTARSTCCRSCSTCRCCSGTRTCSRRPGSTRTRRRPPWRSTPTDAKAIQALNKPGVYGTATGLNCGGCLVFTWFPSIWAVGDQVHEPRRHRVAARQRPRPRSIYCTWHDLWKSGAVLPSLQGRGRPDLDRRLHRRARSG